MPRLAIALVLLAAAAAGAAGSGSGIHGRATSSPTCPVERMPPDPACAPRGFKARVRVYRLSDRKTMTRLVTGDDGRFTVALRPGGYGVSVRPVSGQFPRCPGPVKTTVKRGRYARVAIDCDSGIR